MQKICLLFFVFFLLSFSPFLLADNYCEQKKNLSFNYLPNCSSCLKQADVFLSKSKLSGGDVEEYKILLADSWTKCNSLKKEIYSINCSSLFEDVLFGTNISQIYDRESECFLANARLINFISKTLNRKAIYLENQGISQMPDTKLFDFYSKVNFINYNMLHKKQETNLSKYIFLADTYISDFLGKDRAKEMGLDDLYEVSWKSELIFNYEKKPAFLFDFYSYATTLLSIFPAYLSFFWAYHNLSDIAQTQKFLDSDLDKLQKAVVLINGEKESCNSEFLLLLSQFDSGMEEAESKRKKLISQLYEKRKEIAELTKEIESKNLNYIDSNFLSLIYSKLKINPEAAVSGKGFSSFAEIPIQSQQILKETSFSSKSLFSDIVVLQNKLSLAEDYLDNLKEFRKFNQNSLQKKCLSLIGAQEAKIKSPKFSSYENALLLLKLNIKDGDLKSCISALDILEELVNNSKNETLLHQKCLDEINELILSNNLVSFAEQSDKAKKDLASCISFKKDLVSFLSSQPEVSDLESSFHKLQSKYLQLKKIKNSSFDWERVSKRYGELSSFFPNSSFDLKQKPKLFLIKQDIDSFNSLLDELLFEDQKTEICKSLSFEPLSSTRYKITLFGNLNNSAEISCETQFSFSSFDFSDPFVSLSYSPGFLNIKLDSFQGFASFLADINISRKESISEEIIPNNNLPFLKKRIVLESSVPSYYSLPDSFYAVYLDSKPMDPSLNKLLVPEGKHILEIYEKPNIIKENLQVLSISDFNGLSKIDYKLVLENKSKYKVPYSFSLPSFSELKNSFNEKIPVDSEIMFEPFEKKVFYLSEVKPLKNSWNLYKENLKIEAKLKNLDNNSQLLDEIDDLRFSEKDYQRLLEIKDNLKKESSLSVLEEEFNKISKQPIKTVSFIESVSKAQTYLKEGNTKMFKRKLNDLRTILKKEIAKKEMLLENKISLIRNPEDKEALLLEYNSLNKESQNYLSQLSALDNKINNKTLSFAKQIVERIEKLETNVDSFVSQCSELEKNLFKLKEYSPKISLPVSTKSISSLKKDAEKILTNKEFIKKTQLEKEISLSNNKQASLLAQSIEPELKKDEEKLLLLQSSFESIKTQIRDKAVSSYNYLVDQKDRISNKEVLAKAKEAISQKNFLRALGYLSLAELQPNYLNFVSLIIPLIALVGFFTYFYLSSHRKKDKKKKKRQISDYELILD